MGPDYAAIPWSRSVPRIRYALCRRDCEGQDRIRCFDVNPALDDLLALGFTSGKILFTPCERRNVSSKSRHDSSPSHSIFGLQKRGLVGIRDPTLTTRLHVARVESRAAFLAGSRLREVRSFSSSRLAYCRTRNSDSALFIYDVNARAIAERGGNVARGVDPLPYALRPLHDLTGCIGADRVQSFAWFRSPLSPSLSRLSGIAVRLCSSGRPVP